MILCRRGKAEEALQRLREIMGKLKLTVNEEKTRICKVPEARRTGQVDPLLPIPISRGMAGELQKAGVAALLAGRVRPQAIRELVRVMRATTRLTCRLA